jgi:Methyltransferase domain
VSVSPTPPRGVGVDVGAGAAPGSPHYRAFVGAPETFDVFAHMQFTLMTLLGLREHHTLLDIGCGSLRGGRLFLMYLLPDRYFGIEPSEWLVREGLRLEIGADLEARKRPRFLFDAEFSCRSFEQPFDFVLAQSIFSHASVAQIRRCLSEVRACLKPESLFAASFVEANDDYAGETWVYPECIGYRMATIERLAGEAGLIVRRLDWFHAGGQTWVALSLPGAPLDLDALASLNQMAPLKLVLSHYKARAEQLDRILAHPLFRVASRLRKLWARRQS